MAGVVAMASVIEDFDTQSCNKSHKESSSPVVKTITNYFSPVVKTGEKPFSPPRSNNIMDYFSRKASSSKEKTSSPEQSKENCKVSQSAEKTISPGAAVKQPSQKRGRKTSKAARKLVEAETGSSSEEASCLIVQESNESKDEPTEMISGICGSDTAALLAQIKDDACDTAGTSKSAATVIDLDHVEIDEDHKADPKSENIIKNTTELKSFPLSPVVHSNDKANQVKSAAQNLGKDQEAKQPEPDDNSLCDVSMEVNVDEHSQLNNSTVTISFEDFVRSQSQNSGEEGTEDKWVKAHENENISEIEKMDVGQLDCLKTEQNLGSEEALLQVSPRTLTIQAEVHVLSSKQEPVKTVGKLASIFTKRKGASSPAEAMSPTHAEAEAPCTVLPVKRRSNVVLQEEDLELAVLESESLPKSSEAERKQFMAAFKQPSLDGSKTKLGKNHGKQKHPEEKDFGLAEENTAVPPSSEEVVSSTQESNAISKEPAKKGRKKLKDRETVTSLDTAEETATLSDDKKEEFPVTSAPSIPAVRRSRREVVVRNKPESAPAIPVRKTRKLGESKDAAAAAPDSLVKMSTPKTHKSKHVYVAEMLCPPDTKESPIRIKFTRVHKDVSTLKTESGSGLNFSLTNKTLNESKKRRQAKKLVEKAKIIQQSKKTCVEEKGTLRRSSRNEAATKRSYCEDEDSIICVEEDQTQVAREKKKPSKALRSLNDVLGKAAQATKDTKSIQVQEKTTRKVSIFDESSRECSENSQDDEQFKARREFLKSGLPESFRKQIAKTAANKEAYSLSCSSFQPVVHMKQPPTDCPVWSLPWPESALLSHLKEFSSRSSTYLLPASSSFRLRTKPTYRSLCERSSGWRPGMSESVRQLLVEEISTSNPPFPVHMFLTRFLKRRTDHQQHCTDSEPATSGVTHAPLPAEPVGGKRKRMDDEGENAVKVAKKQRANDSQEKTFTPELQPKKRGGRTRRSQRSGVEEKEEIAVGSDKASPLPPKDDSVIIVDDLLLGEDTGVTDVVKEDVLWTDKYQPQHSSDILGNSAAVRRLHSWLREWKLRADREERKKQKDKKQEEGSNDSDWDCGEEESQDGEDLLCNTVLITGPTGVGKTAAVYACAQELGFKVFEVNASSQRSGRLILSQLREATQSHQVDSQGVNAHKPTYFSSYSTNSSAGSVRVGSSPRKINSPCRVVSSPRKLPQSPRGAKRGLAPTSLANFFKMGQPTNKQLRNTLKNERPACSKKTVTENESTNKKKDLSVKSPAASTPNEESKKMATSLILFEEVDVIFDDDSGFLSAIKTFMATTKRPVILTTSDPSFGAMFDGSFDEIRFTTPSVLSVATYLQLLCLAEDVRTDLSDVSSLLKLNGCDIRQSLLQLQFWTRSTGGRQTTRALTHTGQHTKLKPETDEEAADLPMLPTLPSCDTGCTESRLGLFNIEPERDIWELLRRSEEEAVCQELLADSRRRGVDLLYSNMEALLPLPLTSLTTSTHKLEHVGSQNFTFVNMKEPLSSTCLQPEMLPSHTRVLHTVESGDFSDDGSPVKISSRMKKNKKRNCLADKDGLHSDSDSEDRFLSIRKSRSDSQANEEVKESLVSETAKRKPPTPEERVKGLLVSQCLESVADFLDSMSYMDSSLLVQTEGGDIRKTPVGATIKDGLTDEWRVETNRRGWVRAERVLEVQSAVESLSFHRCWASVAEAWDGAQKLDGELGKGVAAALTIPVASHCEGYGFTQDSPCQPQLVQRRKEVMESLMLRNVGTLGNRAAASLDYLPTLRTICRSEQLKEQGKVKRRFLHYLDAIHLRLEKSTLQHLAEDFP